MDERKLEEKELLTVEETIKLFNLSRGKFKRLIREVELSFVIAYGKQQRFIIREELIRYLPFALTDSPVWRTLRFESLLIFKLGIY